MIEFDRLINESKSIAKKYLEFQPPQFVYIFLKDFEEMLLITKQQFAQDDFRNPEKLILC